MKPITAIPIAQLDRVIGGAGGAILGSLLQNAGPILNGIGSIIGAAKSGGGAQQAAAGSAPTGADPSASAPGGAAAAAAPMGGGGGGGSPLVSVSVSMNGQQIAGT